MREKAFVVYFSPTGGTKRAALYLAEGLAKTVNEIDLSQQEEGVHAFAEGDVVVFAGPVFGGRIPSYLVDRLKTCQGNGAKAITAVVYGNRAYDDALLEFNDCVAAQGFHLLASTALVAEHSMVHEIAAGRPDAQDRQQLREFGAQIGAKIDRGGAAAVSVPGKRPYVEWSPMPVTPIVSEACVSCGICAEHCPTQAISKAQPQMTELSRCILCMRCVSICPTSARSLPVQVQAMLEQKLSPIKAIRQENELFL